MEKPISEMGFNELINWAESQIVSSIGKNDYANFVGKLVIQSVETGYKNGEKTKAASKPEKDTMSLDDLIAWSRGTVLLAIGKGELKVGLSSVVNKAMYTGFNNYLYHKSKS